MDNLIELFGDLTLDALEKFSLRTLLKTNFKRRVPCNSRDLVRDYGGIFEYSSIEKCWKLEGVMRSILEGPLCPKNSYEFALISLWDIVVVDLPQLIHDQLRVPISTQRNVVYESLSTFKDRRDYLLYLESLPLVFGEEKRVTTLLEETKDDLRKKHKCSLVRQLYGNVRYVIFYAATGQSCFQFFVVPIEVERAKPLGDDHTMNLVIVTT